MMNLAMAFVDDLECYTHVTCKQAIVVKQNSALPISRNVLRNVEFESHVKIVSSQSLTAELFRQNTSPKGTMLPKYY